LQTKALGDLAWTSDAPEGSLTATFSRFNVVDLDGDVTLSTAFTDGQPVPMVWAHDWTRPVGKGAIRVLPDRAVFEGAFFLDTADGLNAYRTVKNMADLQQYSYGYDPVGKRLGEFEGRPVRFLERLEVFEVSPVLVGAGVGTGTDGIKGAGLSFGDHADRVLVDVQSFIARAGDLSSLRAKEGRVLSEANRGRLRSLLEALQTAGVDIEELLAATEAAPKAADLSSLYHEFLRTEARLNGVAVGGS
jgi:HK97 family phage prohead protease